MQSSLDITWVSKYDKKRCIQGLLLVLSWAIERKKQKQEVQDWMLNITRKGVDQIGNGL